MKRRLSSDVPQLPPLRSNSGGLVDYCVDRALGLSIAILLTICAIVTALLIGTTVDLSISVNGRIQRTKVEPVRSQVSGRVERVFVSSGDTVEVGQLLAVLDTTQMANGWADLEARGRAQTSALEAALLTERIIADQRNHDSAENYAEAAPTGTGCVRGFTHSREGSNRDSLFEAPRPPINAGDDIGAAWVDKAASRRTRARTQPLIAEIDRQRLQAALDEAVVRTPMVRDQLERFRIYSPADGIVLTTGTSPQPNSRVVAGDLLLEVGEPSRWRLVLAVPQQDIGKIAVGDAVQVPLPGSGRGEHIITGSIIHVSEEPTYSGIDCDCTVRSLSYSVIADLDVVSELASEASVLRHGYSVEARIIRRSRPIINLVREYLRRGA